MCACTTVIPTALPYYNDFVLLLIHSHKLRVQVNCNVLPLFIAAVPLLLEEAATVDVVIPTLLLVPELLIALPVVFICQ